jgi:hypothetical protein
MKKNVVIEVEDETDWDARLAEVVVNKDVIAENERDITPFPFLRRELRPLQ